METVAPFDCPMCGQGIVQLSTGSYPVFIRNRSYLLSGVDAVRCDECGEVFATPEEAKVLNRQAFKMATGSGKTCTWRRSPWSDGSGAPCSRAQARTRSSGTSWPILER